MLGKPGKQNRSCTGEMRITPGLSYPFEFVYGNSDGVPIGLAGFTCRLVFWYPTHDYELLPADFSQGLVLAKDLQIADPYCSTGCLFLTNQDTILLGAGGRATLRWSVYMLDQDSSEGYPSQITADGSPWGILHIDRSSMPNVETVRGMTVTP